MDDPSKYLYRGVSEEMHKKNEGLQPKGTSLSRGIIIGEERNGGDDVIVGIGEVVGDSKNNAITMHQRNSTKWPSSGVSTTPYFERAKIYATHSGQQKKGFVYKIDRGLLEKNDVAEYKVTNYTTSPQIPEDDEVILVSNNNGALPRRIVIKVINVINVE